MVRTRDVVELAHHPLAEPHVLFGVHGFDTGSEHAHRLRSMQSGDARGSRAMRVMSEAGRASGFTSMGYDSRENSAVFRSAAIVGSAAGA